MNNVSEIIRQIETGKTYLIQEEPRGPSQLIEVQVTANGLSEIEFPTIPNLQNNTQQNIVIKAMRVIPAEVLVAGPLSGAGTAPLTELVKMSLNIYCEGWLKAQNIPMLTLVDTFIEGTGIPYRNRTMQFANWQSVTWEKTKLEYSNGQFSAGAPYTVLLEVEYVKYNQNGIQIIGPS